ncbi:MAG: ATP-binding protein, partial [Salinirussus sp.]
GLLVTSGGWAGAHVGYLLWSEADPAYAFTVVGLIFGIATIGPWLYFCSAYTGRRIHRDHRLQWLALTVFFIIVAVKMTNPFHGLYFSLEFRSVPFAHFSIEYGRIHWITTGLAYALAAIGYFMLLELFIKAGQRTRALGALVLVTALPVVLNLLAESTPALVDIGYEPLGVTVFAVGVLYVFTGRFQAVRLARDIDSPAVYLDADGVIRDFNDTAAALFPALSESIGEPMAEAFPDIAELVDAENPVFHRDGQYFRLSTNRLTLGQSAVGDVLLFSDVTEREEYRRELERQNERLERFASVVSHDLRNPLSVARSRIDLAAEETESDNLDAAADALDRMETLIEDVLALARQGRSIGTTDAVSLSTLVEEVRDSVPLKEATLTLEGELEFLADEDRVLQLLENLVRNAIDHGGSDVTITIGVNEAGDGFYVADDGPGIPADDRDDVLEMGYTTSESGTGFGLAIVKEIADAHGWQLSVGESADGGARFDIRGVETIEQAW